MYSIVLTNGKVINIKGDSVEWSEKTHTVRIFNCRNTVARIHMENVVGWIDADYKAESEEEMTNHEALRIIYEFCKENSEKDQKTAYEVGKDIGVLSVAVDKEVERIQKSVPYEEIEKAYESILDVEEGGYVDMEEIKVHFCKWLGKEDV